MTATLQDAVQSGNVTHPGWCSPEHCAIDRPGGTHESAPIEVEHMRISVFRSDMGDTYTTVAIEVKQTDEFGQSVGEEESPMISMRLCHVPDLARALLDLFCKL